MSNLANVYSGNGYSVTVVTFSGSRENDAYELDPRVARHSIFVPSGHSIISKLYCRIARLIRFRLFLRLEKPSVVLAFMPPANFMAIFATRLLGVRCVISERVNLSLYDYGLLNRIKRNLFYRFADTVVVQTPGIAEWLSERTKAKTVVIPNFLLTRSSVSTIDPARKCIVSMGRLEHQKGYDLLIEAFHKISTQYPKWKLLIAGEGSQRSLLENLIDRFRLIGRVELIGFVNNIDHFLQQGSIYVQPSRFEGFPNSLLEAMSLGISVIASRAAGEMLIEDGVSGLLVSDSRDINSLTKQLMRLITDPVLREQLGIGAQNVREMYGREKVLPLWDDILLLN